MAPERHPYPWGPDVPWEGGRIAEILATAALRSEVNRFNIGARVTWPQSTATSVDRTKATGTEG
jgi:hypothetical protein